MANGPDYGAIASQALGATQAGRQVANTGFGGGGGGGKQMTYKDRHQLAQNFQQQQGFKRRLKNDLNRETARKVARLQVDLDRSKFASTGEKHHLTPEQQQQLMDQIARGKEALDLGVSTQQLHAANLATNMYLYGEDTKRYAARQGALGQIGAGSDAAAQAARATIHASDRAVDQEQIKAQGVVSAAQATAQANMYAADQTFNSVVEQTNAALEGKRLETMGAIQVETLKSQAAVAKTAGDARMTEANKVATQRWLNMIRPNEEGELDPAAIKSIRDEIGSYTNNRFETSDIFNAIYNGHLGVTARNSGDMQLARQLASALSIAINASQSSELQTALVTDKGKRTPAQEALIKAAEEVEGRGDDGDEKPRMASVGSRGLRTLPPEKTPASGGTRKKKASRKKPQGPNPTPKIPPNTSSKRRGEHPPPTGLDLGDIAEEHPSQFSRRNR